MFPYVCFDSHRTQNFPTLFCKHPRTPRRKFTFGVIFWENVAWVANTKKWNINEIASDPFCHNETSAKSVPKCWSVKKMKSSIIHPFVNEGIATLWSNPFMRDNAGIDDHEQGKACEASKHGKVSMLILFGFFSSSERSWCLRRLEMLQLRNPVSSPQSCLRFFENFSRRYFLCFCKSLDSRSFILILNSTKMQTTPELNRWIVFYLLRRIFRNFSHSNAKNSDYVKSFRSAFGSSSKSYGKSSTNNFIKLEWKSIRRRTR